MPSGYKKDGTKLIPPSARGLKRTKETKKKMSDAQRGRKASPETIKRLRESHLGKKPTLASIQKRIPKISGENSGMWKGDNVGNGALHDWVRRHKGTPNKCEMCGTAEKRKYHWANIDHKYRRVLGDYIRLCVPCHREYDEQNNNYKLFGK